ncbi:MAG: cytochrome P450 [Pseudonocardia sp.]|nr:cytochrome P450 [Pseudonocardia sp.]
MTELLSHATGLPSTPARPSDMIDSARAVWRDNDDNVHVHSHADVTYLLRSTEAALDITQTPGFDPATAHVTLLFAWAVDGAAHQRQRELLMPWLGPRSVTPERGLDIVRVATQRVARMPEAFDVYNDLTVPVAVQIVADLVGISADEVLWLLDRQREHPAMGEQGGPPAQPQVDAYLAEVMDRPHLAGMARAMRDAARSGQITERESHAMVWGAVQASTLNVAASGAMTVGMLIETGAWPPRAEQVSAAVEEAIRLAAPFPISLRVATAPFTLPSGAHIAPGEVLMLHLDSASRDPERRGDGCPMGQFDPARDPNRHLGWSDGRRRCLGVALARNMIVATVTALAEQRPDLALNGAWGRYISIEDGVTDSPVRGPR